MTFYYDLLKSKWEDIDYYVLVNENVWLIKRGTSCGGQGHFKILNLGRPKWRLKAGFMLEFPWRFFLCRSDDLLSPPRLHDKEGRGDGWRREGSSETGQPAMAWGGKIRLESKVSNQNLVPFLSNCIPKVFIPPILPSIPRIWPFMVSFGDGWKIWGWLKLVTYSLLLPSIFI